MAQKQLPSILNEAQVRERMKTALYSIKEQLSQKLLELASLSMHAKKSLQNEEVGISRKLNAFTAITAEIAELSALIEFIESVYVQKDSKSFSMIHHLQEIHAAKMRGMERELGSLAGRFLKLAEQTLQAHHEQFLLPFGENERKKLVGEHAKLIKEISAVCFIQGFGIKSRRPTGK